MTLLELQRRMEEDVRRPLTAHFDMQTETPDGVSIGDLAATYIKSNPLLTSFDRLEIYNRQYWFRVIGAVSEDYPALNAILGPRRFDALVLAYLQENPSTSFSLRHLGAALPAWLAAHPAHAGRRPHLAVDVARLEWAYIEAFDGAALPPLGPSDLGGLQPASTLTLQPHLQLLELRYPVDEVVLAIRRQTPEADTASNAVAQPRATPRLRLPKVERAPIHLAVHRFDNSVYYRRIDPEAFRLLAALRGGDSIAVALGIAFEASSLDPPTQAAKTREYFAHAAELGWFTAAHLPG